MNPRKSLSLGSSQSLGEADKGRSRTIRYLGSGDPRVCTLFQRKIKPHFDGHIPRFVTIFSFCSPRVWSHVRISIVDSSPGPSDQPTVQIALSSVIL